MKNISQLCVFMENRQNQLVGILSVLSKNNINLRALTIAEVRDYGVLRLIVDHTPAAADVLQKAGYVASVNPVFAITVPDRPGGLAELLSLLSADGVDIEYMYSVFGHKDGLAYMIMCPKELEVMQASLDKNGIQAVGKRELGLS